MVHTVFVYGTLLRGESNHGVAAPFLCGGIVPGSVRGRLYDVGDYPALVLVADANPVPGEWLKVTEEGLSAMDELEGYIGPGRENDYERVWVKDAVLDEQGWVYVWNDSRGFPEIRSGSWREHVRNRRSMK
jgi:gamma-glutamylcyclotransferase (GGCT)/AIG2-like uncharacterized protein YtfP